MDLLISPISIALRMRSILTSMVHSSRWDVVERVTSALILDLATQIVAIAVSPKTAMALQRFGTRCLVSAQLTGSPSRASTLADALLHPAAPMLLISATLLSANDSRRGVREWQRSGDALRNNVAQSLPLFEATPPVLLYLTPSKPRRCH